MADWTKLDPIFAKAYTGFSSFPESDMSTNLLANQTKFLYYLNEFYQSRIIPRQATIHASIVDVTRVVVEVLREVEAQEPRFISSLTQTGGRFDGFEVISPSEFEVVLYLNQMGVFNFVDDGTIPGCAALKLSDGRKRSMSLWVEFITASGYLSARKIRARFQTLVAQACEKCRDTVRMLPDTSEVRLRIHDRFIVQITPAFKCAGIWPRSASQWPPSHSPWPSPPLSSEVKSDGFNLVSRESIYAKDRQSSAAEGDAWVMSFREAEDRLLRHAARRKCLSIIKALRDRHLDLPGQPVTVYILRTLMLYECEKHPRELEWTEVCVGDRILGVLLQLISCLQCRHCPHYFLPQVDLFKGKSPHCLDAAAKQAWKLIRELLTNPASLQKL